MSDFKDFCPLWGEWEADTKIGEGVFSAVWRMKRNVVGGKVHYSAVRHISIPRDQAEVRQLISDGFFSDEESVKYYYTHILQSITDEIDAINKLQGHTNIVAYEDQKVIPKEDGVGYDLFLRMELLKPLTARIRQGMSIREVVSLGKDIATAIDVLYDHHMIHGDIKPQNIFVNDRDVYKLGDCGTARVLRNEMTATRKGIFFYLSPEISNNQKADIRSDIYSLGLVLYRLLNGNRLPFVPLHEVVTAEDTYTAIFRRDSGEKMDPPAYADDELAAIVLKACAFRPEDRYTVPKDMIRDLEKYKISNETPAPAAEPEKAVIEPHRFTFGANKKTTDSEPENEAKKPAQPESKKPQAVEAAEDRTVAELPPIPEKPQTQANQPSEKKKKKRLIPVIAIVAAGLIAAGLFVAGVLPPKRPEPVAEIPEGFVILNSGMCEYVKLDEHCIKITRYIGDAQNIFILEKLDGYTITEIGNNAFHYCDSPTSITLPNSLTSIGDYAFSFCHSLSSIVIPESVIEISDTAFSGCISSLTIEGKKGSYAEQYANSHGIPFTEVN